MIQSVRYQVFVSSTFSDLIKERSEIIQALWELDCIPTGMEAFLATNETQWEVIKKVIDECDYYVLVLGGRYGSVTDDGISYTEKEYDYAKSVGVPVLGFVHGDVGNIPVAKSERQESGRQRLDAFRKRVMSEHPIREWTTAEQLGGLVSRSVLREIKVNPRPGWIRSTGSDNVELLKTINDLRNENDDLRKKTIYSVDSIVESGDLARGSDKIEINGWATIAEKSDAYGLHTNSISWSVKLSWDSIFKYVGPGLLNEDTEEKIMERLTDYVAVSEDVDWSKYKVVHSGLFSNSRAEIIIQLRALGLIAKGEKKRALSDKGSYWKLTELGEIYLVNLMAKRRGAPASE